MENTRKFLFKKKRTKYINLLFIRKLNSITTFLFGISILNWNIKECGLYFWKVGSFFIQTCIHKSLFGQQNVFFIDENLKLEYKRVTTFYNQLHKPQFWKELFKKTMRQKFVNSIWILSLLKEICFTCEHR